MIWNPTMETMHRTKIRELQLERLQHIVRYCYENVPFYHQRFDSIGLKPEHIRTLEDVRLIPPTTKADLRDNYPFGLFAVPRSKVVRIHASSEPPASPRSWDIRKTIWKCGLKSWRASSPPRA